MLLNVSIIQYNDNTIQFNDNNESLKHDILMILCVSRVVCAPFLTVTYWAAANSSSITLAVALA